MDKTLKHRMLLGAFFLAIIAIIIVAVTLSNNQSEKVIPGTSGGTGSQIADANGSSGSPTEHADDGNVSANTRSDLTIDGWMIIQSEPAGAAIFVDDQPLLGPDGNQLMTPCTAYIASGTHMIKISEKGYADSTYKVQMEANQQTQTLIAHLQKS